RCALWLEHADCRLGYGLDFNKAKVRDYTLALIREALERYDCDGLELDFNRFPTFFAKDVAEAERIARIDELVEGIRKVVDAEAKKRKRHLILAARVPTDQRLCRSIGCDPVRWATKRWIDFLTISEFLHVRYDLPVKPWKQQIKGIPIYAS